MKEAVTKSLGKENLHAIMGKFAKINSRLLDRLNIANRNTVDTLHHQHFAPAVLPVNPGHINHFGIWEVAAQLAGVSPFTHHVQFIMDGFVVISDNLKRSQASGIRPVPICQPC